MVKDMYYDGEDPMEHLLVTLNEWADWTLQEIKTNNARQMTEQEEIDHALSNACTLCHRPYTEKNKKVNYSGIKS